MGYIDLSDEHSDGRHDVDGLDVVLEVENTQRAMKLGKIKRIILHWTGGSYRMVHDVYHYCVPYDKIKDKAHVVKLLKLNELGKHAFKANTGSVGISLCGMRNAVPSNLGEAPITKAQLEVAAQFVAEFIAWHKLPLEAVTDHYHVDIEVGRREKQDIKIYWNDFKALLESKYAALKAGKANFQYKGILTD
jgi:N-acetylmuramoyl-L-alanine amidase